MTTASPASQTARLAGQAAGVLADAPHLAAAAVARADLRAALAQAERAEHAVTGLRLAVVADLLADGADWRQTGEALAMHPQAAYEAFGHLADGRQAPAAQRQDLAIVLTAGLDSEHDVLPEYGIDVDDLGPDHSVNADPGVVRIREAARLLGTRAWIRVTTPGGFEGAEGDPAPGEDAISQWTSVVTRPEELTWLIEALALNVMGTEGADDELD
ncbi:MAG: hypothetical protein ACRDPY_39830 [Streptosporangiaceae bacterium]